MGKFKDKYQWKNRVWWHVEYLQGRWFMELRERVDLRPIGSWTSKCRLVVDEWEGEPEMIRDPQRITVADLLPPREITVAEAVQVLMRRDREELAKELKGLTKPEDHDPFSLAYERGDQAERQRIYELLHRKYGCRIYG